jgi:cell division protein ZapE
LCIKPLGVADYLEISKHFNVIFISEIPKMNVKKRNEIKRFVNLVDTLYEARSILFILADVPAKDLLDGGKDYKIFQRTISRLEEMQSADYLNSTIIKQ